jgi:hypothetical protein
MNGLFGGDEGNLDDTSALRYTAPKEKKKKAKKELTPTKAVSATEAAPAGETATSEAAPGAAVTAAAPAAAAAPSKVLASAHVRLYKVNTSTGAYEACAEGAAMGAVVIGTGGTYALLVYDSARKHWATTPISAKFSYNVSNLYISFHGTMLVPTEQVGSPMSLLFADKADMTAFLRTLGAASLQAGQLQQQLGQFDGLAPCKSVVDWAGETQDAGLPALTLGSTAAIYYKVLEVSSSDRYANEALTNAPLCSVLDEKLKIKVEASGTEGLEEPLGGMAELLVGLREGDVALLGIPTGRTYEGTADISSRARPDSWMMVEVTIVKTKTAKTSGRKKEKEKEKEKEREPAAVAEAEAASPSGKETIKERMARLSNAAGGGGGGGGGLAAALGKTVSSSPRGSFSSPGGGRASFTERPMEAELEVEAQTQAQTQAQIQAQTQAQTQAEAQAQPENEPVFVPEPEPEPVSTLTAAPAQKAIPTAQTTPNAAPVMRRPSAAAVTDISSPAPTHGYAVSASAAGLLSEAAAEKHFLNMQQTLSGLQYGMMQLQSKLDSAVAQGAMGGVGGMNQMQQLMHNMTQQQQQQQQQQQPPMTSLTAVAQSSGAGVVDGEDKYTGLPEGVRTLLTDYLETQAQLVEARVQVEAAAEQAAAQAAAQATAALVAGTGGDPADKEALEKAKERAQTLSERNEKLVDEKHALLEKQSGLLERINTGHDKVDALRRELEGVQEALKASESKADGAISRVQFKEMLNETYGLMQDALEAAKGDVPGAATATEGSEGDGFSRDAVLQVIRGVLKQATTKLL